MSVAQRIAKNSIYQLIGKFFTLSLSLAMVMLLSRKLGVSAYGDYTTALTFSQLFSILADIGISVYLLKALSSAKEFREPQAKILGTVTEVRVITAILGAIIALGITTFLPYSNAMQKIIAIALVAVIFQMVNSLYVTVLQSRLEMKYAALSEVIGRFLMLIGSVYAIYINAGVVGIFIAQIFGNVVNLIITYIYSRRFTSPKFTFNTKEWQVIIKSSALIGISSILSYIYFKTDTFLLSVLQIPGKINSIEVGLYGSSYKILEILIILPGVFMGSIFPLMSASLAQNDREKTKLLAQRSLSIMLGLGLASSAGLVLFSDSIIHIIAGSAFAAASVPLTILAFAVPLNFISSAFTYALLALERQKSLTILYGLVAIANVGFNLWLIPQYSYVAAASVTVGTELIVTFGSYFILQKYLPNRLPYRQILHIIIGIGLSTLLSYLTHDYSLWLALAVYISGLLVTTYKVYPSLLATE